VVLDWLFGKIIDTGTDLHLAAKDGDVETVKRLLLEGANLEARYDGNTALVLAVQHPNVVKALLEAGADVNSRNSDGYTPLNKAALGNAGSVLEVATILIAAGANPNTRDVINQTALGWANHHKNHKLATYLRDQGGEE
jgi:ankyrin repeat protein